MHYFIMLSSHFGSLTKNREQLRTTEKLHVFSILFHAIKHAFRESFHKSMEAMSFCKLFFSLFKNKQKKVYFEKTDLTRLPVFNKVLLDRKLQLLNCL